MSTDRLTAIASGYAAPAQETPPGAIVVGINGSDTGRSALQWAVGEARLLGAPLVICHVQAVAGLAGTRPVSVDFAEETLWQARATAAHSLGPDRVVAVLRSGDPARALARLSEDARLLVVGTHGSFAHGARLFPPFSARIITRAHCPVVAVPVMAGRMGSFRGHVVVGVDGSAPARAALGYGFAYAARHGLPLAAVNVTDEPAGDYWTDDDFLETHFAEEPRAETLLATEAEPWEASYPDVHVKRAVYTGHVVPGLLRAAAGARLLVVGDRGRGLATSTVLGSVAQHLIGSVTCPIAVIKSNTF